MQHVLSCDFTLKKMLIVEKSVRFISQCEIPFPIPSSHLL